MFTKIGKSRTSRLLAMAGLLAAGLTGTATVPASAATTASCYGGATYFYGSGNNWPSGSQEWAYTTTRCSDINVMPNRGTWVGVCFQRTGCNDLRWAPANQWTVAASGVRDGSAFYYVFDRYVEGMAAF
ncbi:hypothetical protein [Streptomyces roseolus]|uniref:hypothetical protein n=1 Tax=Streptomyces roseolus TaxID=67358 RepID=UPI00167A297C|nr:hypothetical protein [Streptomyces roseolus]GGR41481.1 hypothetical protein GCM10010282_37840 [Streptomyces roseolus]